MKKALIIIFTLLIVIFAANIIFYIITDDTVVGVVEDNIVNREKTLDEFFNIKSQNLATHTYLDNVSSIDGYKIKLLESALDTKNHKGYFKFELTSKDTDMRKVFTNESPKNQQTFCEEQDGYGRFEFFVSPDMGTGTIGEDGGFIKHKNKMFIYYSYNIEGTDVSEPKEVYLWDRNVISNDSSTSHESKIAAEFVVNW